LNYPRNFEITHLKFSLTNQCHKTNWLGVVQGPVNAGSLKVGVKTAQPNADYIPYWNS